MNKFKIIAALLVLYGAGKEFVDAGKQLLTFFDPGIIISCLLMIFFSAWLLTSGMAKGAWSFKSWFFAKYFGLACLGFCLVAFFSLITHRFEAQIIETNGVKVDIAEFMNYSKPIVPDEDERRAYCSCMVSRLTADQYIRNKYAGEFEKGKIDLVFKAVKDSGWAATLGLNDCFSQNGLSWTPAIEKSMRDYLMEQLAQAEHANGYDLTKYCDCLMEEYKKLPLKEVTGNGFFGSTKGMAIDSTCRVKSKKR